MPIVTSSSATPLVPVAVQTNTNDETNTYQFIAGWVLLIVILTLANKTRIGHVVIYYSLLLLILLLLLLEYQRFTPLLNSITTIGQFNP